MVVILLIVTLNILFDLDISIINTLIIYCSTLEMQLKLKILYSSAALEQRPLASIYHY